MATLSVAPLAIGQTSTNASLESLLGAIYTPDSRTYYMLVKSFTSAITAAQNVMLIWKSGSADNYVVDAVSGAAAVKGTCAGIAQLSTTAAPASSYFWVARQGPVTATTADAVAAGAALATHGAAGAVDDTTVTYATQIGVALDAIGSATTGTILLDLPI
jgi:hypothetical protein